MRLGIRLGLLFAIACWLTAVPLPAPAQNSAPQSASQQAGSQQQQDQEPLETFKVDVNVVSLYFNVKDKKGALIPSLKKEDFQVFEDGKPQTIKYFTAESNQPLTLGLMIDTSGSQTRVLPFEQEAGSQFLRDVLRDKDLAFVISFDVNVELLQDFTSSGQSLRAALNRARVNTGGGSGGVPGIGQGPVPVSRPRGTLLYDAIFLGSDEKLKQEVGRKAMIILTDGEDQGSQISVRDAIEAAQKSDAICYVLLIEDNAQYNGFGAGEMKKLAQETGGRVIEVGNESKKLREAFQQISNELRSQYSIGYTPTNQKHDGTYRKVEIKTTAEGFKVQSRKGYYATKQ
ncbi:MAG TPA: VWA domain-containing protein [Clostridia bacterium]|nr:VWA domain-containing protein [Clostridia bacterium]